MAIDGDKPDQAELNAAAENAQEPAAGQKPEKAERPLSAAERQKEKERLVDEAFRNPDNVIIPVDLDKEMRQSFIDYAMSVITDRALPDVRDGLKPVHRRILYSMLSQGFTADKPYRKLSLIHI